MGILDSYSNADFGGGVAPGYSSINEVRRAYDEKKLTYSAAYRILMDQFGLSDLDIQDVLVIEPPQFDDDVPLEPGLEDPIDVEVIPDTSNDVPNDSKPMSEDQRFMLIGFVVLAGLYGLVKR